MEGRESLSFSAQSSAGSAGGGAGGSNSLSAILQRMPPPGLHAPAPMRPSSNANTMYTSHDAAMNMAAAAAAAASGGGGLGQQQQQQHASPQTIKRKRGRPRKYGPDGSMALALASHASVSTSSTISPSSPLMQKRGRGRPPGSGKKQQLAALGKWLAGTSGVGFTPHVVTVAAGEDVAMKIMSFSQLGSRAICILSANGAVSNVTLRRLATSGGTVTFEGRFEILSLSGSFLPTESGGISSRTGGLSVSLAGPDGRVIGGGVAGMLMAAGPVQVVVGSFLSGGKKSRSVDSESSLPSDAPGLNVGTNASLSTLHTSTDESLPKFESPVNIGSSNHQPQNHSLFPPVAWPGSQSLADSRRNTYIDISLPGG